MRLADEAARFDWGKQVIIEFTGSRLVGSQPAELTLNNKMLFEHAQRHQQDGQNDWALLQTMQYAWEITPLTHWPQYWLKGEPWVTECDMSPPPVATPSVLQPADNDLCCWLRLLCEGNNRRAAWLPSTELLLTWQPLIAVLRKQICFVVLTKDWITFMQAERKYWV